MDDQNAKGQLIILCNKNRMSVDFREVLATGPSHDPRFTYHVFVNNEKLGEGQGKTKKAAVNTASKMALAALQSKENINPPLSQVASEFSALDSSLNALDSSATESSSPINGCEKENLCEVNYVGKFNELCQKKRWMRYNFLEERRGPPHIPEFFCRAVIEEEIFPEAKGKNKKEAKKNAAFLALKKLKMKYPDDIQVPELDVDRVEESESENPSVSESTGPEARSSESKETPSSTTDTEDSIVFSSNLPPTIPFRSQRKVELAPKFSNLEQAKHQCTLDETFLRDFDCISNLDKGGFGMVFKALKKLDNKYYAVKRVELKNKKAIAEVETLASLEHSNIVRYFHSWTGDDYCPKNSRSSSSEPGQLKQRCLFIQMEWCEKGNLETWIDKMNKVEKQKSLDIFRQIIQGVIYIHSQSLIHRDLKPGNIFFATEKKIKIGDFGLVAQMTGEHDSRAQCRTKNRGTESYMAPEQEENSTYENEVDIFPLGLILIELFWKFNTKHEKQDEWPKLREAKLPKKFVQQYPTEESIIKRMLSQEPRKRPTAIYLKEYFEEKIYLDPMTH